MPSFSGNARKGFVLMNRAVFQDAVARDRPDDTVETVVRAAPASGEDKG
jgi:hypothetical protein